MPEPEFKLGADTYLFEMAPFFGPIKTIGEPQGAYRIHGGNNYCTRNFEDKLESEIGFYDCLLGKLENYCRKLGLVPDMDLWLKNSWFHRLQRSIGEVRQYTSEGSIFLLVDDMTWGISGDLSGRTVLPFLENGGIYAGSPANDQTAISELCRLRQKGAAHIIFTWSSFWWLEHYGEFHRYLRTRFACVLENERLVIFDLRKEKP